MSQMIPIDNYDAQYVDDKTRDWHPCRVIGIAKGDNSSTIEFIVLITKFGKQRVERVETVRLNTPKETQ